ncbi:MAG: hypothetical protein JOZ26_16645 [Hyphomicrobiales bacterium]|nr:hypothetical protein [Hyphomicrobiales bacterium]
MLGDAEHAVARLEFTNSFAAASHRARAFDAETAEAVGVSRVDAERRQHVQKIQARGFDFDFDFGGTRRAADHRGESDTVGIAGRIEPRFDGFICARARLGDRRLHRLNARRKSFAVADRNLGFGIGPVGGGQLQLFFARVRAEVDRHGTQLGIFTDHAPEKSAQGRLNGVGIGVSSDQTQARGFRRPNEFHESRDFADSVACIAIFGGDYARCRRGEHSIHPGIGGNRRATLPIRREQRGP